MHLVSFIESGAGRIGVLDPGRGEVVDLARAAPGLPRDMQGLIALGEAGLREARDAVASGAARLPLAQVRLCAPLRPVRNVFCVGKNFRDHVHEVRAQVVAGQGAEAAPEVPIFFTKSTSSVIGPGEPIPASQDPTETADYEGELAVVIGRGGRGIARAEAFDHVYGYTILNDVTSRRLQKQHQQWFLGKSLDGFCPLGPALVTRDAIPAMAALRIRTHVNGELRQDGMAADMVFDIPTLVAALSAFITLQSGDILSTGTPAGVGAGFAPPRYLRAGDRVAITLEPIGTLENPVG
ncbi:MAG: fumarylacetoacetate hydrolase family protein [Gammaproteobacteria bacterium]|nr:fumarylacetoacetate hydrolase family protein [Gammaproteobacteria bacterium]